MYIHLKLMRTTLVFSLIVHSIGLFAAATGDKPREYRGAITFTEIGDRVISSYGGLIKKETAKNLTMETSIEELFNAEFKPKMMTDQEMRQRIFGLLATVQPELVLSAQEEAVVRSLRVMLNDIELFYCHDRDHHNNHLFSKIDCTHTIAGQAMLAKMLTEFTTDVAMLKNRQTIIAALLNDQELFDQLETLVTCIKKAEPALYSYWAEQTVGTKNYKKALYFDDNSKFWKKLGNAPKSMNSNPVVLEFFEWIDGLQAGIFSVYLGASALNNVRSLPQLWALLKTNPQEAQKLIAINSSGILFKGFMSYAFGKGLWVFKDNIRDMQTPLMDVGAYIRGVRDIENILHESPGLKNALCYNDEIVEDVLYGYKTSERFNNLRAMLETNTFKGEASYLSYCGRILATNYLMDECKNEFIPMIKMIGKLDAYLSLVRLMKKTAAQEQVSFCMVQFIEHDTPYIRLNNFWNPQIDACSVVANDIELGAKNGMRNMVLTGSNTGGKSTLSKSILETILLAQTVGIAPAREAQITPFTYVADTMNAIDNTLNGESLYQAEVNRIVTVINNAKAFAHHGKKCFIVMDEPLRGTSSEQADNGTHRCATMLTGLPQVSFLLVTHCINKPLMLEQETHGVCQNYKIEVLNDGGRLIKTYKLKRGINAQHVAKDILELALNTPYEGF